MTEKLSRLFSLILATVALTGCLIPEKFDASVTMNPDGSYRYQYDGSAYHFAALQARAKSQKLSDKDEATLTADAGKLAQQEGVKKLRYLGEGKHDVLLDQQIKPGQKPRLLPLINVSKSPDGTFSISGPGFKEKELGDLKRVGVKVDGTLSVYLPKGSKVLAHNADSTPGFFSSAYKWKIGGLDAKPSLTVQLPSP